MGGSRRSELVVWVVPVVSTAMIVAALVLHARTAALMSGAYPLYLADLWVAVLMPPLGAWLWSRGGSRAVAVVLLLQAMLAVCGFTGELAAYDVAAGGDLSAAGSVAAWLASFTWAPYLLVPTLVPLLYPRGRDVGRAARTVAALVIVALSVAAVVASLAPGEVSDRPGVTNPLGVAGDTVVALGEGSMVAIVLAGIPVAVVLVVLRAVRRSQQERLHRVGVVAAAAALLAVSIFTQDLLPYPWNDVWVAVAFTGLAAAVVFSEHEAALQRAWRAEVDRAAAIREEERRRVRADLHDGLGPELAGLSLGLAAVSRDVDDAAVRAQLQELRGGLSTAVAEVRRIVDGLRPSALHERGLRGALAARAERLRMAGYVVDLDLGPADGHPLPSPVEVAAFRIADEALTNVVRHAAAQRVRVRCSTEDAVLTLCVEDDGRGTATAAGPGVGLPSMRARAAEVGGEVTVDAGEYGGTRVRLLVPTHGEGGGP
jgi:signal transduction histidine kinase